MGTRVLCLVLLAAGLGSGEGKYDGPVPAKSDLPYLLQAQRLTEIEVGKAREEKKKDGTLVVVVGAASTARTPLPEPILILDARKIAPERLELFLFEVKDGNREVSLPATQPLHLRVTPLKEHLYKIEPSEMLEAGEYALRSGADNQIFCFQVY